RSSFSTGSAPMSLRARVSAAFSTVSSALMISGFRVMTSETFIATSIHGKHDLSPCAPSRRPLVPPHKALDSCVQELPDRLYGPPVPVTGEAEFGCPAHVASSRFTSRLYPKLAHIVANGHRALLHCVPVNVVHRIQPLQAFHLIPACFRVGDAHRSCSLSE